MTGALLASIDISKNKAFTAAALKMPTSELTKEAAPDGSLYGIQNTNGGRIVVFGGGYPYRINGEVVGAIGISGGTVAEDMVLATDSGLGRVKDKIDGSFSGTESEVVYEVFNRECSQGEIDRVVKSVKDQGCDCIIAVGGGKTADTGKAAAYYAGIAAVVVPTIASTDAP